MKQNLQTRKPFRVLATLLLFLLLPGLPGKAWAQDKKTNWEGSDAKVVEEGTGGTDVDVTFSTDKITYTVYTAKGLAWIAWVTNEGKTKNDGPNFPAISDAGFRDCTVVLAKDIDLSGYLWTPIGTISRSFMGSFKGQWHRVTGMEIDMTVSRETYVGLFGAVNTNMKDPCVIKNLGVEIVSVNLVSTSGTAYAAGIVGRSEYCTIEKCYVIGGPITVTSKGNRDQPLAGGIVGYDNSNTIIKNCYSTVAVTVSASGSSAQAGAGGIAGYITNEKCSYCYATGDITGVRTSDDDASSVKCAPHEQRAPLCKF